MYALVLTICSFASCNDYVISVDDSWIKPAQCNGELEAESTLMGKAWVFDDKGNTLVRNNSLVEKYLKRFGVQESISTLINYDYNCVQYIEAELP